MKKEKSAFMGDYRKSVVKYGFESNERAIFHWNVKVRERKIFPLNTLIFNTLAEMHLNRKMYYYSMVGSWHENETILGH